MKKIVLVDMDNVLVDFQSGIYRLSEKTCNTYKGRLDEVPGIFSRMDPMEGAIEAYHWLAEQFDTYILSTAPWGNPTAWTDKRNWVEKYLPGPAHKRLILSHHKNLVMGDYLIDDRTARGVDRFTGMHIHFGSDRFPGWKEVKVFLEGERV